MPKSWLTPWVREDISAILLCLESISFSLVLKERGIWPPYLKVNNSCTGWMWPERTLETIPFIVLGGNWMICSHMSVLSCSMGHNCSSYEQLRLNLWGWWWERSEALCTFLQSPYLGIGKNIVPNTPCTKGVSELTSLPAGSHWPQRVVASQDGSKPRTQLAVLLLMCRAWCKVNFRGWL